MTDPVTQTLAEAGMASDGPSGAAKGALVGQAAIGAGTAAAATGGAGAAAAGGGAGGAGGGLAGLAQGITAGIGGLKGIHDEQTAKRDRKILSNQQEDLNNRREATYRFDRQMLLGALGSYYKKQGWEMPTDTLPGVGTTKQLPFENPLYNGPRDKNYAAPETANIQPGKPIYQDPGSATGIATNNPSPAGGPSGNGAANAQASAENQTGNMTQMPAVNSNPQQMASDAIRKKLYGSDAANQALAMRGSY